MEEAMAADQDKSLCRGGSFYAEDSFLLSDYLHRQAKKACNRFFNHTNSLFFLRSSLILLESQQREEEENSDRSCPPVLKSMPVGLSAAHKDTSESLTDRECSSHVRLDLEQEKGDSSSPHRTLASSVSYVESSECCEPESAAEAATRIEAIAESLRNSMLCHESKQAISLSNDGEEDADDEDGVLTTGLGNTEALNFLVIAAMQVDNDDEDVDFNCNVALRALKSPSKAGHDTLPVHGNCPILKKNMICRARSALQKQNCDDSWQRLEISEAVTRVFESKGEGGAEHHPADLEAMKHKGFMTRYRQRKLRDLSLDPSYVLGTACTDVDEDLERKHGEENNWPNRCFGEVSDVGKESGNLQVLPSMLPSSLSTEGSETAHRREGNGELFVDHRKLQVLSARVSNACTENLKRSQMQGGQPRIWSKLENSQAFSTPNKCGRQFVASNGATKACCASKEKRKSSMKKLESQEEEEAHTPLEDTLKNVLRLKILPIRLPNADLPLLEEVSKSESTEVIVEDRMVTRKRRSSRLAENVVASASRVHKALPMPNTQVKDGDPVIRTKRGRSQVIPTKFSDSVLQPWKSSRKKCKLSF